MARLQHQDVNAFPDEHKSRSDSGRLLRLSNRPQEAPTAIHPKAEDKAISDNEAKIKAAEAKAAAAEARAKAAEGRALSVEANNAKGRAEPESSKRGVKGGRIIKRGGITYRGDGERLYNMGGVTYRIDGDDYYMVWENHTVVIHIPPELKDQYCGKTGLGPNGVTITGKFRFIGNAQGTNAYGGPVTVEKYEAP